ncbi:hypothetical protein BU23DRAFT_550937 [Bimuria novae-zelandiae CBS 107.79]|uniref:Uncharacterized protein n=1 Tax=Bimuria novae-zelandiae CBS 107.79 TaxID=1447943 RepID=A0A6A5VKK7_9PLEO|nr:hypothetical protein BU23DRAFT_550937 [Bimuria novae-zelandiae CBS 107.79]
MASLASHDTPFNNESIHITDMESLLNLFTTSFNYLTSSGGSATTQNPQNSPAQQPRQATNMAYTPSYADICVARAMLKSFGLPTELVIEILAYAQYEPVLEFAGGPRAVMASASMGSALSARICLRAEVLSANTIRRLSGPHVTLTVKEIEFDFTSKDQGWTTENTRGTYNTSSWLEVSIFRPSEKNILDNWSGYNTDYDSPQAMQNELLRLGYGKLVDERPVDASVGGQGDEPPLAWYLQGNKVTERQDCTYRVVWSSDHYEGNEGAGRGEGFLNALKEGDSVWVWARAKYPGWRCEVNNIRVTVRYGFEEPS